jgi:hypothetical protein
MLNFEAVLLKQLNHSVFSMPFLQKFWLIIKVGPPSVFSIMYSRLSLMDKQLNIRQNYENTGSFNHLQILNKSANSRIFSKQICYFTG